MHPKNQKSFYKYIAFEGIDGSGKSTQAKLFTDYIKRKGFDVFLTKEPGGVIEDLRNTLLNRELNTRARLFLFLADRSQTSDLIRNKLKKGLVVSDRSMYSTLAYQGYGDGLDLDFLSKLNMFATDNLKPDLIFCIDIPLKEMKKRLKNKDIIESKSDEYFKKVREGYLELKNIVKNYFIINGNKPKQDVFKEIVDIWEML